MSGLAEGEEAAATPAWTVRGLAVILRRIAGRAANLLLPPLCVSCRAPVDGHGGVCPACWAKIDFIEQPLCDRLGIPLPYPCDGPIVSAAALADPPAYGRARAVARYDGVMRELVHGLKYGDRQDGVALFARWLTHAGCDLLADAHIIVPVPLYRLRLWTRRFNQSALMGRELARRTGLPFEPLVLKRTRRTVSQVGLSAEQRRRNVAGAFAVDERRRPEIEGRNILLLDDVITTGATAEACTRALLRAGAARVDVLALARVTNPLAARL
ncbi:MAG: ComF family protein [Pseudomonadota bacterium]|nr:ComF family protein [Pseudomonadota bacterium]